MDRLSATLPLVLGACAFYLVSLAILLAWPIIISLWLSMDKKAKWEDRRNHTARVLNQWKFYRYITRSQTLACAAIHLPWDLADLVADYIAPAHDSARF